MFASSFGIEHDNRQKICQICVQTSNKTLPLIALVSRFYLERNFQTPCKGVWGQSWTHPLLSEEQTTDANILWSPLDTHTHRHTHAHTLREGTLEGLMQSVSVLPACSPLPLLHDLHANRGINQIITLCGFVMPLSYHSVKFRGVIVPFVF